MNGGACGVHRARVVVAALWLVDAESIEFKTIAFPPNKTTRLRHNMTSHLAMCGRLCQLIGRYMRVCACVQNSR